MLYKIKQKCHNFDNIVTEIIAKEKKLYIIYIDVN